jgi:hypothetical protein
MDLTKFMEAGMTSFRSAQKKALNGFDLIPPDRQARPTTGVHAASRRVLEVSDADYEIVTEPRRATPVINDNRMPVKAGRVELVPAYGAGQSGVILARRAVEGAEGGLRLLPLKGFMGLAAFLSVTIFLAFHFYGPGGSAAQLGSGSGGLAITAVQQSPIDSNGLRIIVLTGSVENHSSRAMALPPVVAQLTSANGVVSRSAISLGDAPLAAGQSTDFSLRIPYPGGKSPKVSVSFASKGV